MSNDNGPKSSKKSTKSITTAKKVKETKSVPITVQLNILKVLINERSLIPLLRILKRTKSCIQENYLSQWEVGDMDNLY